MNKHFLVTISDDTESLSGIHFLCSFFQQISKNQATLLHICRLDSDEMLPGLSEMWNNIDDPTNRELSTGARRAIYKAKELLGQNHMSVEDLITKTVAERYGKVKDILQEGAKGLYDVIIFGKRASYTLQWVFERPGDETAQTLLKDSCFTSPIWICPEPEPQRKDILLCVDGSENSLRTVDHVGYIISNQKQHSITLLHVVTSISPDSEIIFRQAEKALYDHDISRDRIIRCSKWGFYAAGTILGEIDRGGYAAVALGLHGHNKHGLLKEYNLAGGTTSKLISKLEKTSLWCCP